MATMSFTENNLERPVLLFPIVMCIECSVSKRICSYYGFDMYMQGFTYVFLGMLKVK